MSRATATSRSDCAKSRYECPHHRVSLVLEVIELSSMGMALTNIERVSFYRCPSMYYEHTPDQGEPDNAKYDAKGRCMFMKPNKWQKYPINGRHLRTEDRL